MEDLIDKEDPFKKIMDTWVQVAENEVIVLPPSKSRDRILLDVQVTTHSILGTLIYHTGGILIDHGWVRVLGSGNSEFSRDVHSWNKDSEKGLYLVADDAAGGFFAINGGMFDGAMNTIHYWAPDSMQWEPLELEFSDFFRWLVSADLEGFYETLRWENWRSDLPSITTDECMSFYPPLWTKQGECNKSYRSKVPISEALNLKYELLSQINNST